MKKLFSLVLLSGFLLLFGCAKNGTTIITPSQTEEHIELKTYENSVNGFSLQYPGNRTYQENVSGPKISGSSVIFISPLTTGDTFGENVGIIKQALDKPYTLADYYTITKQGFIKLIPGFTEISNEALQINGIDAQKLIYTGMQDNTIMKWEQVYLIKNQEVYILTYTATEKTFNDFINQADHMVTTLQIK